MEGDTGGLSSGRKKSRNWDSMLSGGETFFHHYSNNKVSAGSGVGGIGGICMGSFQDPGVALR